MIKIDNCQYYGYSLHYWTEATQSQKETVNAVLDDYGKFSSQYLVELTHAEDPWKQARKGLMPQERGNNIIPLSSMAEYYSSLK